MPISQLVVMQKEEVPFCLVEDETTHVQTIGLYNGT
jgi:hypothetical protein